MMLKGEKNNISQKHIKTHVECFIIIPLILTDIALKGLHLKPQIIKIIMEFNILWLR